MKRKKNNHENSPLLEKVKKNYLENKGKEKKGTTAKKKKPKH